MSKRGLGLRVAIGVLAASVGKSVSTHAGDGCDRPGEKLWSNASGGSCNTASNWACGVLPAADDVAVFSLPVSPRPIVITDLNGLASPIAIFRSGSYYSTVVESSFNSDSLVIVVGDTPGETVDVEMPSLITTPFQTYSVVIGAAPGSEGVLYAPLRTGIWELTDPIIVGAQGVGVMTIDSDGVAFFENFAPITVGLNAGSVGLLEIKSEVQFVAPIVGGEGMGTILCDAAAYFQGTILAKKPTVVTGRGTYQTFIFNNGGTICPGDDCQSSSVGVFMVNAAGQGPNFTQFSDSPQGVVSGRLLIDLNGIEPGSGYDTFECQGCNATLGGLLECRKALSFAPQVGDSFVVMTAKTLLGTRFDVALLPALQDAVFQVLYGPSSGVAGDVETVTLEVVAFESALGFDAPTSVELDGTPSSAVVGQLDADPRLDLAITLPGGSGFGSAAGQVGILFNLDLDNGQLTYETLVVYEVGNHPVAIDAGDVNGDGFDDLAVANSGSDSVSVLFNDGLGGFATRVDTPVGSQPMDIKAASLDGEQGAELVVANSGSDTATVLTTAGGFLLKSLSTLTCGAVPCSVEPIDVDDDGVVDVLLANHGSNNVFVFLGDGGGGFDLAGTFPVDTGPVDIQAQSLNGDTLPEIVTSNSESGSVSVLVNKGNASFAPSVNLSLGSESAMGGSIVIVDLDEDNDADIGVVASTEEGLMVKVLRNDTNGGSQLILSDAETLDTSGTPLLVSAGDLDGDDDADLITINEFAASELSGGVAGNPFSAVTILPNSANIAPILVGDINGDGMVNGADLGLLLSAWGSSDPAADLSGDGLVNGADLGLLLGNWTG